MNQTKMHYDRGKRIKKTKIKKAVQTRVKCTKITIYIK